MPSLQEVLNFREDMYTQSKDIIEKKGHDYNRQQQLEGDTLYNLRVCELLGVVPTTEQGILVRLSDKFMRLISLTAPGVEPENKNESVLDTVKDIHNYVDYLALIWLQRNQYDTGGTRTDPCPVPAGPRPGGSAVCPPQDGERPTTAAERKGYW